MQSSPPQATMGRILIVLAAAVIVLAGMRAAAPVLNPIMFTVVLSLLVSLLYSWLRRQHLPSWLSLIIMMVVLGFAFGALLMTTLFFVAEGPYIMKRLLRATNNPQVAQLTTFGESVIHPFGLWAIVNGVTAILVAIALLILGIDSAILWSIVTFFLSYVSYSAFLAMPLTFLLILIFNSLIETRWLYHIGISADDKSGTALCSTPLLSSAFNFRRFPRENIPHFFGKVRGLATHFPKKMGGSFPEISLLVISRSHDSTRGFRRNR